MSNIIYKGIFNIMVKEGRKRGRKGGRKGGRKETRELKS